MFVSRSLLAVSLLAAASISLPAAAAVHATSITTKNGRQIERSELYTRDGKLLMVESGNRMIFRPSVPEFLVVEDNGVCRVLDKQSAQAGMPDMQQQMQQHSDTMEQARRQMAAAMAEARKEGMTPEQEATMKAMTEGLLGQQAPAGQQPDVKLVPTGDTGSFGEFGTAEAYRADGGPDQGRFVYWLLPVEKINGGAEVRDAIGGMIAFYEDVMDSMGIGQLMNDGLLKAIDDQKDKYPVAIDDLAAGTREELVAIERGDPGADYDPECTERKGMFGM